ncbi:MAG: SMI1/KNR4 family protein [Sphingomonas sp.]|uniref:SMI1/KNR4 family protein n=1 Tax=Sphingomonas sp. TaxID=28214 RepID=UPI003F7CEB2E
MTELQIEPGTTFSDDDITSIEASLGRRLPVEYVKFVKEYGSAFVGGLIDGDQSLPILTFFGPRQIVLNINSTEDFTADQILPFARCELGNIWAMDASGVVHYINYYGGRTVIQRVDNSFERFVDRIVLEE